MQELRDGKSKEARSGDTMEEYARCDVLPFSSAATANDRCVLKAVNKKKLSKLNLRGSPFPPPWLRIAVVPKLTLAIGQDRPSASNGGCTRSQSMQDQFLEQWRSDPSTRDQRIGYRPQIPATGTHLSRPMQLDLGVVSVFRRGHESA